MPAGSAGEIFIGGDAVADGYINDEELTRSRFLPDPFVSTPAKMYRTGDIARYDSNGEIQYLGRVDEQIKVRGVRIEPGEIEAVLREVPGVTAAVVVTNSRGGHNSLDAYVTGATTVALVRSHAREKLPEIMMPATISVLASFPTLPNGKLDRAALRPTNNAREASAGSRRAAPTAVQAFVTGIWCQVLGAEHVDPHDKFFEIGGDSLLLLDVFYRIDEAMPGALELAELFEYVTVSQLADRLETAYPNSGPAA